MTVDSVSQATAPKTAVPNTISSMGSDAFLQLLVTKLKNQDPTNPQTDTDFIAQLAQFSSLERLTSIDQNISSLMQVFSAVGGSTTQTTTAGSSTTNGTTGSTGTGASGVSH